MVSKILCVAEKPAIAKSVAQHLSGGLVVTVSSLSVRMDLKGGLMILRYVVAIDPRLSVC